MPRRAFDVPAALPVFPMGENSNLSALVSVCPHRDYKGCFTQALTKRYPSPELFSVRNVEDDTRTAAKHAARLFPKCAVDDVRTSDAGPVRQLAGAHGPGESFVSSALGSIPAERRIFPAPPNVIELRKRLRDASAYAVAHVESAATTAAATTSTASSSGAGRDTSSSSGGSLRCASPARALDERLLMLIGLPTTARDPRRREAARESWMQHPAYGRSIGACFLLSAHAPAAELDAMVAEHRTYGDLLLLDAPETRWLITRTTKYSNFTKMGRGMPTFKQYAFFQHAAAMLPNVPYVGKIDDDTAPNLGLFLPLLRELRCRPHMLIGAINWAAVVPNASDTGVRNDRCGFGWSASASLTNFGTSFGMPPKSGAARGAGYFPACDGLGAVAPFPYGTGAGYIFSRAVLHWVGTDPGVVRWVRDAAGPTANELQWQKFEDTSTGYWLTYAPFTIEYMNVGRWVHDMACSPRGRHKAKGGGLYRPPSNLTLLVHNLKNGGFHYAAHLMAHGAEGYDHGSCMSDLGSVRRSNRNDARHGVGVRGRDARAKAGPGGGGGGGGRKRFGARRFGKPGSAGKLDGRRPLAAASAAAAAASAAAAAPAAAAAAAASSSSSSSSSTATPTAAAPGAAPSLRERLRALSKRRYAAWLSAHSREATSRLAAAAPAASPDEASTSRARAGSTVGVGAPMAQPFDLIAGRRA